MRNFFRIASLGLLFLWAACWDYFALVVGIGVPPGMPRSLLPVTLFVVGFTFSAYAGWKYQRHGGILLMGVGVLLLIWVLSGLNNPPSTRVFLALTLALPPALAGAGLFACRPETTVPPTHRAGE